MQFGAFAHRPARLSRRLPRPVVCQTGPMEAHGKAAERVVFERVRAALPAADFHLYPNAEWLGPMRDGGPARDGEADLVIVHEDLGILVLEVKSGAPTRDQAGRWWIGGHELSRDPFEQAKDSKIQLVRKLEAMPDWPPRTYPRAGHAIALPEVDLASLPRGHAFLGADAPPELVLDAETLEDPAAIRRWVEAAYAYWLGDGTKGAPLGALGVRLLDEILAPTWSLRRLVRGRIEDDRAELLAATRAQELILNRTRSVRRLEVVGPAGSGKSMLAAEKARRLAREGYRTLLVCFNSRLATSLIRELEDAPAPGGLDVTTFHRLCERLGGQAGVLPPVPIRSRRPGGTRRCRGARSGDRGTPRLAISRDRGGRGPGLRGPLVPTFSQRLLTPSPTMSSGSSTTRARRSSAPMSSPASGFSATSCSRTSATRDPSPSWPPASIVAGRTPVVMREAGRRHEVIAAEPGAATLEALRKTLHRLLEEEQVPPWRIAVLSGVSAPSSIVWQQRRFGNAVLTNEALLDDGRSKGLAPEDIPEEPDEVLFESIRRFKGMEREVVVLVELPTEGDRLDELLYVGLTRATTELVVIAPAVLAERLQRGPGRAR